MRAKENSILSRFSALILTTAFVFGAAGFTGCKRSDALVVRKVLVDVEPASIRLSTQENISREAVRALVMSALDGERSLVMALDKNEGDVLRVRVASTNFADGARSSGTLAVSLDLADPGGDVLFGESAQDFHGPEGQTNENLDVMIAQGVRDAIAQLVAAKNMKNRPTSELVSELQAPTTSPATRLRAIRVLGARGDVGATPALITLLERGDVESVLAAIRALSKLGAEEAMQPIIKSTERFVRAERVAVRAAQSIGGHYAASWLFTLSTGHPDVTLQQSASAALQALESEGRAGKLAAVDEKK